MAVWTTPSFITYFGGCCLTPLLRRPVCASFCQHRAAKRHTRYSYSLPALTLHAGSNDSRSCMRRRNRHGQPPPHSAGRASAKSTQRMLLAQVLQLLDAQGRRSRELEAHVRRALHVCSRQAVRRIGGPTRSGTAACQVLHPGGGRRALPAVSAQATHASLGSAG